MELFVEGGGASCRQNFLQLQGVGCAGLEGLEAEGELSLDETHWNSLREQFFRSVLLPVAADRGTRSTIQRHSSCQSVIVQRGALQAEFSLTCLFAVGLRKRSTCSSSHSNTRLGIAKIEAARILPVQRESNKPRHCKEGGSPPPPPPPPPQAARRTTRNPIEERAKPRFLQESSPRRSVREVLDLGGLPTFLLKAPPLRLSLLTQRGPRKFALLID